MEQIAALTQFAEQINPRLTSETNESVDLDNLFAFLSEIQPGSRKNIIDEIASHMDELVEDLDMEVKKIRPLHRNKLVIKYLLAGACAAAGAGRFGKWYFKWAGCENQETAAGADNAAATASS